MKQICLVLVLAVCAAVNAWSKPEFCGRYSCPGFTTIFKNKGYALRCYNGFWTARTKVGDVSPKAPDYKTAFMRLFKYISGNNDKKMKIEMTVPVLQSSMYNTVNKTFVANTSFYINVKTPPTPSDDNVALIKVKPFCVYVKPFIANVQKSPAVVKRKIMQLYKEVSEHKQTIMEPGFSMYASYSMPGSSGYHEVSVLAPRMPLFREMWRKKGISKRCYVPMNKDRYAMIDVKVNNPKPADFAPVFKKLESYMNGMNAANSTPERGNPIIIDTRVDAPGKANSKIFYYLPGSAPAPLNKDITIVKAPGYCVYVKSFKGVVSDGKLINKETIALMKHLTKWKQQIVPGKYFFASYGMSKNHEVWMASK